MLLLRALKLRFNYLVIDGKRLLTSHQIFENFLFWGWFIQLIPSISSPSTTRMSLWVLGEQGTNPGGMQKYSGEIATCEQSF